MDHSTSRRLRPPAALLLYNQGFAQRTVVVTAQDATAPFLRVDVYTKFTGGGRSNYATTQTLH
jgi:hypothetical protein